MTELCLRSSTSRKMVHQVTLQLTKDRQLKMTPDVNPIELHDDHL